MGKNLLIVLAVLSLMSCATLAAQPQEPVDESQAVAEAPETKPVDAYVWIPRDAEDQEATKATITGDDETVRWVPLKITVNVPVPEDGEGGSADGDK